MILKQFHCIKTNHLIPLTVAFICKTYEQYDEEIDTDIRGPISLGMRVVQLIEI